ncbi:MAG TPA: acyltransferase [Bryobacteraceae bacterium]|nr:acyltransferase [Bryobacteraceae bacterium]
MTSTQTTPALSSMGRAGDAAAGEPHAPPQKIAGRSIKLDALRGVAILLVFGRHQQISPDSGGALSMPAGVWQRFGWTGVDLFFVLSGFLVGGLLLKEIIKFGNLRPGRFLIRRGLKIWPSYYVYLAWVAVEKLWIDPPAAVWHSLWPSVFSVQNYLWLVKSHLWSLAVEEHFYLCLPLALICFASTPALLARRRVLIALVAVALGSLFLRGITGNVLPDFTNRYYTHLRIDSLAFGFLLAYVFHVHPRWWRKLSERRGLLFLFGLLAIAPAAILTYRSLWLGSVGLTALYLGYGAILIACVSESARRHWLDRVLEGPVGRSLAFIGFSSYSIYLWHIDIGGAAVNAVKPFLFVRYPELHWLAVTAVFAATAVASGILIGRAVEMPVLHLRDRFFPTRVARVVTGGLN